MESTILVIHLILAVSLICMILLQRSEGGGLGIGGGGGLGSLASPHSTASALTKATQICAACFFITSLILAILAGSHHKSRSIMDALDQPAPVAAEKTAPEKPEEPKAPSVPVSK